MTREQRSELLLDMAWWAVIVILAYLVFRYLARLLMPFVLAFLFASLARPLCRLLSRDTRMVRRNGRTILVRRRIRFSRAASGVFSALVLLVPLGAGLLLLLGRALDAAMALPAALPRFYEESFAPGVQRMYDRALSLSECLDAPARSLLASALPEMLGEAGRALGAFSGQAVAWLTSVAARLPGMAVNLTIFVIATVFISADYDAIKQFIRRNLPERGLHFAVNVRNSFVEMARQFLQSYFLLFCITVGEIALGLALIGVRRGGLIALTIGVLDAFPVVGSGLVLLPWAIVSYVTGDTGRGAGLLALYLWVTVFRQVIEPRILGRHVGLRPAVTLLCMYAGGRLFGAVGLIGLPVTAAILTDLNTNGVIHLFYSEGKSAAAEGL